MNLTERGRIHIRTTQRPKLAGESEIRVCERFKRILPRKEPRFYTNYDSKVEKVLRDIVKPQYSTELEDWIRFTLDSGYGYKYCPEQVVTAVERFQGKHAPNGAWRQTWKQARLLVSQFFNPKGKTFKPALPTDAAELCKLIPWSASYAGYSYYLTGKRKKGEYFSTEEDYLEWRRFGERLASEQPFIPPSDPIIRVQNGGLLDEVTGKITGEVKFKSRLVEADDVYLMTWDAVFHREMMNMMFHDADGYSTGKDPDTQLTIIRNQYRRAPYWVNIDFSHYDQSIAGWMMDECFDLIREWLVLDDPLLVRIWENIKKSYSSKELIWGRHTVAVTDGMFSGKLLTNVIDSMVQVWMLYAYFISKGFFLKRVALNTCGDDGLIFTAEKIDLNDMASYLLYNFGIEMNPDKCAEGGAESDPWYLKRRWTPRGAWRDPRAIVAKMLYPEHYHDYVKRPELSPELMVWAAILTYPVSMKEWFDTSLLERKHPFDKQELLEAGVGESPSGLFVYMMRYTTMQIRQFARP